VADGPPTGTTEADQLAEALRAAAVDIGGLVTVRGPIGAGKSALLRALAGAAEAAGAVVLRAGGTPAERDWDFGVADQLRPVPPGFVVIVVDDLQWADEESVRWLIGLASRVLVVTAIREGEPGADIALPGQVVRLRQGRPRWSRHGLAACLRRQPEPVRGVARAMAVLGGHAGLGLVSALAGLDDGTTRAALGSLRALGLVTAHPEPRFADPAVAAAVIETMTTSDHDSCHTAAAALLYDRGHPAECVAEHLVATRSVLDGWAIGVLRAAADTAARQGRQPVAARYLRRVALAPVPGRTAVLVDLAAAEYPADGRLALQRMYYATCVYGSCRDRAAAVLRMPVAMLGAALPPVRRMISDIERCVRGLGDRDLSLRIEARMRFAGYTDPAELTDSSVRLREFGPEPGTAAAERELLTVLSFSAMLVARVPAAEVAALADRLLAHAPPSAGHADGMTQLLVKTLCAADSPANAAVWVDRALALERGNPDDQGPLWGSRALVALHLGDVAEARRMARTMLEHGSGEWALASPDATLALAVVALRSGDQQLSERLLASRSPAVSSRCTAILLDLVRGGVAVAEGDEWGGLRRLTDTGRQLDRMGWRNTVIFPWRTMSAGLYRRLGDDDAARALAEEDHERALEWGAPAGVGRALRVLGGLTGGACGVDLLHGAVEVLTGSANRIELARAHLALGLRLRDRYEQAAAEHLRRCHDLAVDCGDLLLARQASAHLRGKVRRPELTRTERRVVALAVDGQSNQEIAETLAVSTRAVEKHLTNSYRKLGIRRRAELADALNRPH
jgi:DNA-binding CsgD family transcriptional regulator/energy-coupling factor transporter ATP-binding protein EcfA2